MSQKISKYVALSAYVLVTLLCVHYAHAAERSDGGVRVVETVYRTSNVFTANCSLKVIKRGSAFSYVAMSSSKSEFKGFWPSSAGLVQLGISNTNSQVLGESGLPPMAETLDILFEQVGGELRPVAIKYGKGNPVQSTGFCYDLKVRP